MKGLRFRVPCKGPRSQIPPMGLGSQVKGPRWRVPGHGSHVWVLGPTFPIYLNMQPFDKTFLCTLSGYFCTECI